MANKKSSATISFKAPDGTKVETDLNTMKRAAANLAGHNRRRAKEGGIATDQLRSIIERIERLTEEKSGIASDISDVYSEAKGTGFDVKTIRKIIRLRKQSEDERGEEEHMLSLYKRALGMQPDLFDEPEE